MSKFSKNRVPETVLPILVYQFIFSNVFLLWAQHRGKLNLKRNFTESTKGRTIIFLEGGGGGGMKNLSLQTFFFLSIHLCKQFFSNNTFLQTIFFFDLY